MRLRVQSASCFPADIIQAHHPLTCDNSKRGNRTEALAVTPRRMGSSVHRLLNRGQWHDDRCGVSGAVLSPARLPLGGSQPALVAGDTTGRVLSGAAVPSRGPGGSGPQPWALWWRGMCRSHAQHDLGCGHVLRPSRGRRSAGPSPQREQRSHGGEAGCAALRGRDKQVTNSPQAIPLLADGAWAAYVIYTSRPRVGLPSRRRHCVG